MRMRLEPRDGNAAADESVEKFAVILHRQWVHSRTSGTKLRSVRCRRVQHDDDDDDWLAGDCHRLVPAAPFFNETPRQWEASTQGRWWKWWAACAFSALKRPMSQAFMLTALRVFMTNIATWSLHLFHFSLYGHWLIYVDPNWWPIIILFSYKQLLSSSPAVMFYCVDFGCWFLPIFTVHILRCVGFTA